MKYILALALGLTALLSLSSKPVAAALVPVAGSVKFNLYGVDYVGPNAGVLRNPDSSGPLPIAIFPGITESDPMFDPSPASLATARGNATFTSTGTNELVLAEGEVIQPNTAKAISRLTVDTATAFVSAGSTPAHLTNLSYQFRTDLYPVANVGDPEPFASFDATLLYFINGVLLPDPGVLHYEQVGPTAGPVQVTVTGPDGTVFVPQLNDGDVLAIVAQLSFTVSHGAFESVLPEPASLGLVAIALATFTGRCSRSRKSR